MDYDEDIFLEDRLYPWLADDSMADPSPDPFEESEFQPDYFCEVCDAGLSEAETELPACPHCGHSFT